MARVRSRTRKTLYSWQLDHNAWQNAAVEIAEKHGLTLDETNAIYRANRQLIDEEIQKKEEERQAQNRATKEAEELERQRKRRHPVRRLIRYTFYLAFLSIAYLIAMRLFELPLLDLLEAL